MVPVRDARLEATKHREARKVATLERTRRAGQHRAAVRAEPARAAPLPVVKRGKVRRRAALRVLAQVCRVPADRLLAERALEDTLAWARRRRERAPGVRRNARVRILRVAR